MQQQFEVMKNLCLELSLIRPTMIARQRGAVLTIHQSYDGEGYQDRQRRNIFGPSWGSHLPASHSCNKQGLQNIYEIKTIIL
jgi:hypothetical protein